MSLGLKLAALLCLDEALLLLGLIGKLPVVASFNVILFVVELLSATPVVAMFRLPAIAQISSRWRLMRNK